MAAARELAELQSTARKAPRSLLDALLRTLEAGEEAASALGITRQGVDKRRRAGRLLAVTVGRRGYLYPAWQFTSGGVLPGLEQVLAALRDHDSWMQLAYMVNPNTALGGRTPLVELRDGNLAAVLRAARTYGEQVAV